MLGGVRLFFKVQAACFALFMLGAIILPVVVGVVQSRAGFLGNFNDYAANLGTKDAVAALQASARKAGYAPASFDLTTTLKSVSIFWFIFGFIFSSTYFAGEIRLQKRTHIYSMPGAVLLAVIVLALLVPSFTHIASYEFNGWLGTADPAAYGFTAGAPAYPELVAIGVGLGDHRHRGDPRVHDLAGDLAAPDAAAREPQHVRVVVRPRHARPPLEGRSALALPAAGDRRDAGAVDRQHGGVLVHDLVQRGVGAARALARR